MKVLKVVAAPFTRLPWLVAALGVAVALAVAWRRRGAAALRGP